jgi:hypothetical protein
MGIPVGSKLFSTAFAGEAVDRAGALPDLVPILVPPFSSAGFTAEAPFPSGLRLHQKFAAVRADGVICHYALDICLHSFSLPVQVVGLAVTQERLWKYVLKLWQLILQSSFR